MEQQTFNEYRDRGLIVLSLIYDLADATDADAWADDNGALTYPILVDTAQVGAQWELDNMIPSYTLIAPGLEILIVDGAPTAKDIEANLP